VQVMETRKRVLGEEHPDTLTSMGNLASTYRNQGRWNEAEKLEVQVMETSKTKLWADHPDTLTSKSNLASTWKRQDKAVLSEILPYKTSTVTTPCRTIPFSHNEDVVGRAAVFSELDTLPPASHKWQRGLGGPG